MICPKCGSDMYYIDQYGIWICPRCYYVIKEKKSTKSKEVK